jgi:hypothetical protein
VIREPDVGMGPRTATVPSKPRTFVAVMAVIVLDPASQPRRPACNAC